MVGTWRWCSLSPLEGEAEAMFVMHKKNKALGVESPVGVLSLSQPEQRPPGQE